MICSNCGSSVDGSKKFCQVCGYAVKQITDDGLDQGVFSGTSASGNAALKTNADQPDDLIINKPSYPQPATPAEHNDDIGFEEKPKRNLHKKILIPVVALILAATMAFGAWGIYVGVNPEIKIAKALNKTLFDSKSYAFEFEYKGKELAEGYVSYGKTTFGSDFVVDAGFIEITCDNGRLLVPYGLREYVAVDMPEFFEEFTENLNEVIFELSGKDAEETAAYLETTYGIEVTSEQLAKWAETIVSNRTVNEKVVEELWNTVGVPVAATKLEIEESDVPDYGEFKGILADIMKNAINDKAFRIEDKYKEDGVKYYVCKINPHELEKCVIEYALTSKKLEAVLGAKADPDDEKTIRETLESRLKALENGDDSYREDVEMILSIKDGYLTSVKYGDVFEIKLTDINKNHDAKEDYDRVRKKAYLIEELEFDEVIDEIKIISDKLKVASDVMDLVNDIF